MSKILTNPAGNIKLELRDDRLSAWLTILDKGILTDEQDILDLIEQAGIKYGFEEALKYMRKHGMEKEYDTPFPVAMCNRVQGESKLNYFFDLEQAKHFDGKVSLDELKELTCIEPGTVLADYSGNIFERQGSIYDIYGEMLQDENFDPDAIGQIRGENVKFDQMKRQFVAERSGFPSVDEAGRISVIDRVTLTGDFVNLTEGIRSPVSLQINGNVELVSITAAGDVFIDGNLRNSAVYCEGDLQVDGDVLACGQPGLEVWGNIRCSTLLSSKVLCRGRIEFERSFLQCETVADGGIFSREGALSGGHIESGGDVTLGRLGDPVGITTEIEITISPFHKAVLMRLTREMIRLKQDLSGNAAAIMDLSERIKACEAELDRELNNYLKRPTEEKLRLLVHHAVFPPVRVRILKHEYEINKNQNHLEIVEKE
ncbi:MAG: FapA family protein [Candidatus Syntrophosphaera sp.]|nr:FapA family protein [Candidatus Syntrophosphaera sp.]